MQPWVQPYGTRFGLDLTAAALMIATVAIVVQVCGFVAQGPSPVATWIVFLTFDALFLVMAWRIARVGLYINEHGVKVRMVLRTRIVPWNAIALVREGSATGYDARAVVLALRGQQRAVETPIWHEDGAPRHRNRIKLDDEEFHRLIDRLNAVVGRYGS